MKECQVWIFMALLFFPFIASAVFCGYFFADFFISVKFLLEPALMLIMLTIGPTLKPIDFVPLLKSPWIIQFGISLQFIIMPLLALIISRIFFLSNDFFIGMILVGRQLCRQLWDFGLLSL